MMQKSVFLILIFGLFYGSLFSQDQEKYVLHMDKPFYATGENLYYKLFLPDRFEDKDLVVQINLSSKDKLESIAYIRSYGNKNISGRLEIPLNFETGQYFLDLAMTDDDSKIMTTVSSISFQVVADLSENQTIVKSLELPEINEKEIICNITFPDSVEIRSKSKVNITVTDSYGRPMTTELSVSIVDKDLHFGDSNTFSSGAVHSAERILNPGTTINFYGQSVSEKALPVKIPILGAFDNSTNQFLFTKSNDRGDFLMSIPDFEGQKTIQFIRHHDQTRNVNYKPNLVTKTNSKSTIVSGELMSGYQNHSKRLKLINEYFSSEEASPVEEEKAEFTFEEAPTNFDFREYKKFQNLGNFFKELITPLVYTTDKNGTYSAVMANPAAKRSEDSKFSGSPLFIVDGLASKDADLVAKIPFENIKTVGLFHNPKQLKRMFNVMGLSGAVIVNTNLPDFKLDRHEQDDIIILSGLQPWAEVQQLSVTGENTPRFRPQLYWNPVITTNSQGEASFDFIQSDDISNFVITVVAKDQETVGTAQHIYKTVTNRKVR